MAKTRSVPTKYPDGMAIELRLMRYVVTVADEDSFSRAAQRLHMAQPPLSRQIRDLERSLGVDLFQRRPTRLTEAGRVFVNEARRLLAQADELAERTRLAGRGLTGTLRLGYDLGAAYDTAPLLIDQLRGEHPGLHIEEQEAWPPQLERLLGDDAVDVIICPNVAARPDFERELLRREPMVAMLDAGHPLASRDGLRLAELRGSALRFHPRHLAPAKYDFVVAAVHSTGERFSAVPTPTGGFRRMAFDPDSFGIALESMRAHLPATVACVPFLDPLPMADMELLWRGDRAAPRIRAVVETARKLTRCENWASR